MAECVKRNSVTYHIYYDNISSEFDVIVENEIFWKFKYIEDGELEFLRKEESNSTKSYPDEEKIKDLIKEESITYKRL